jgi:hypothetical protein
MRDRKSEIRTKLDQTKVLDKDLTEQVIQAIKEFKSHWKPAVAAPGVAAATA